MKTFPISYNFSPFTDTFSSFSSSYHVVGRHYVYADHHYPSDHWWAATAIWGMWGTRGVYLWYSANSWLIPQFREKVKSNFRQMSYAAVGNMSDAFSMEKLVGIYGGIRFFPFQLSDILFSGKGYVHHRLVESLGPRSSYWSLSLIYELSKSLIYLL